jgi:hydrogenase expression/formation protein HypC
MVCTTIPALVTSTYGSGAVAEVGGQPRPIDVFLTPEVRVGDYVLLRHGYATTIISEPEALEILKLLEEIARIDSD